MEERNLFKDDPLLILQYFPTLLDADFNNELNNDWKWTESYPVKDLYQLAYYSKVLIRNKNKKCKGKDEHVTTLNEISFAAFFKFLLFFWS